MLRRALAAVCLATLACRGTEPDGVPGYYVLQSISYNSLPATIVRSATLEVAVLKGSVTLNADMSFVDARSYRTISGGVDTTTQADTLAGTYSVNGDVISLTAAGGIQYEMINVGTSLTWYAEGFTYRFWK